MKKSIKSIKSFIIQDDKDICNIYFGFDVSSTTVGWAALAIYDGLIQEVYYGHYKPEKENNTTFTALMRLQENIIKIIKSVKEKVATRFGMLKYSVGVEDFLLSHPTTSAKTITTLSVYNTTVCMAAYNWLGIEPQPIHIATIRATLRNLAEIDKKDVFSKEHVPAAIEKIINKYYPSKWKFRILTKRTGNISAETYDMSDAIAVAITYAYKAGLLC